MPGTKLGLRIQRQIKHKSPSSRNLLSSVRKGSLNTSGPWYVCGTSRVKHISLGQILSLINSIPFLLVLAIFYHLQCCKFFSRLIKILVILQRRQGTCLCPNESTQPEGFFCCCCSLHSLWLNMQCPTEPRNSPFICAAALPFSLMPWPPLYCLACALYEWHLLFKQVSRILLP